MQLINYEFQCEQYTVMMNGMHTSVRKWHTIVREMRNSHKIRLQCHKVEQIIR